MSEIELDTNIHMGCRTEDGDNQYNWHSIDMKTLKPSHDTLILMCGGNNTNCERAGNGNAKVPDLLLSSKIRGRTKIYSLWYDGEPISSNSGILLDEYRIEAHEIFPNIIRPMLCDQVGNIKEKQGIEKVLNKLVLSSHCGGSEFVNIIIDDMYDFLASHYHPSIAKQLIGKVKYFAYAPFHLPNKAVNSFIITPFFDNNCLWTNVLNEIEDKRVCVDYPRGVVKKLQKARERGELYEAFKNIFGSERMIVIRSEQSIYVIPNRLNANTAVGDHSIDCLIKNSVLGANTDCANTARVLNKLSQLVMNQYASGKPVDSKELFDRVTAILKKNRSNSVDEANTDTVATDEI